MTITTPALLFGANALILLAYSNRFFLLAKLVRDISADSVGGDPSLAKKQIKPLRLRIRLIKYMQAFGVLSFLLCTISMLFLFIEEFYLGQMMFGLGVVCIMISLLISLWEVLISTQALDMVLDDLKLRK